jgi:hypothetical protein
MVETFALSPTASATRRFALWGCRDWTADPDDRQDDYSQCHEAGDDRPPDHEAANERPEDDQTGSEPLTATRQPDSREENRGADESGNE